jgi:hypothetical protein
MSNNTATHTHIFARTSRIYAGVTYRCHMLKGTNHFFIHAADMLVCRCGCIDAGVKDTYNFRYAGHMQVVGYRCIDASGHNLLEDIYF